jgi:HD superfamily phosphodiesterase
VRPGQRGRLPGRKLGPREHRLRLQPAQRASRTSYARRPVDPERLDILEMEAGNLWMQWSGNVREAYDRADATGSSPDRN